MHDLVQAGGATIQQYSTLCIGRGLGVPYTTERHVSAHGCTSMETQTHAWLDTHSHIFNAFTWSGFVLVSIRFCFF